MDKIYIAIDLKSFYASVECKERNLDPLTTNLVVADFSRTSKTICLAVSPSLKSYGIPGRARLFEVEQKVKEINIKRRKEINYKYFTSKSTNNTEIINNPYLELDFIIARPRMKLYIEYSTKIYSIYLKYVSKEDIHVYSIDEVFIDITDYLKMYKMTPYELTKEIIKDILKETGITATGGIGTNLYLAKVAMDIMAKHVEEDFDGVRIAYLDEKLYKEKLWSHIPLTDFWRVGKGYAKKLEDNHMYTMGDIARCSLGNLNRIKNEELLYKLFGVDAEILIDHAWGIEPCTIKDIKNYKPKINSISSGQVLSCPYDYKKAKIIVKEMADLLSLNLVDKNLVTNSIILTIVYDSENINNEYTGAIKKDYYGRKVPKEAHGTISLDRYTSSSNKIIKTTSKLYDSIMNKDLSVRRIYLVFGNVLTEELSKKRVTYNQLNLFDNIKETNEDNIKEIEERKVQKVVLDIKKKYGKNAVIKAMDLEEGATTIKRNKEVGGHHE